MVKSTILKKVVSLTLSVVFLFFSVYIPDTAYAQAGSNTPLGLPHAPVYHIDNITIPKESGNIRESHQGTNGKFIVNIQDAHVNYEGQKNLSAILKELIRDYGISLVLVEGGTGDVGLSFLRHFSTKKRREKIADKYLKKGKIAGEEYLDIVSDPDLKFQIYGIEDKYLYKTNLKQFLRVDKFREKAARFTDSINNALEILKDNLYSDELKGFDKNRRAYEEADLDIVSYCKYLVSIVPGGDQIEKLLNIERLEKAIDFDVVTAERDDYITALSKRLIHNRRAPLRVPYDGDKFPKDRSYDEDKLNELLKEALDFKSGLISPKEFYAYIKELGDEAGMDMKEYPNLHIYTYYIEAFDDIDHDRLFKEIAGLEDEAGEALCKDDTQRKIRETAKKLSLIRRFVNLQLSPADLKEYSSGRKGFDLREWVNFINDTAKKYNLKSISVDYNPIINKNLRKPEAFYRIAKKRDKAFFNNAIKVMEKRGEEKAVIIAGGFHTEHLMPLFKDKGFSYVVVTPKIARKSDYGLYRSLLRNEMSIEEKVMEAVFDSLRGAALLDPSREAALEVILREIIFERGFLNSELVSQPLADFIIAMCQTAPDGVIATGIRAIEDVDLETQKITVLLNDGTRRIFLMNELRWREVTTDPSGAAPKKRQQTTTPVRKIHEGIGCKPGESIMIGPDIQVKVINIKGKTTKKAKLKFVGVPADVTVYRAEEYGKIEKDPAGKIRDYTFSCRVNEGFVLVRGNTKIRVWISFIGRDGKKAWLGTDTPKGISVLRKETFDRIAADASAATDASGAAPGKVDNIGDVVIRRARGQSIMIGPDIEVKVLKIKGKTAKRAELAFVDAPGDVVIYRGEEFGIKKKKPRRKGGTYALERREGQCAVLVRGDDEIRVWISYIEERVVGIATDAPEGIRVVQKENFDRSTSDASKTTPEEIEYPGGLTLTRKPNESIMIGPDIEVKHLGVRGVAIKRAQLLFLNVPADVVVYRGEEYGRKTKRPQEKSGNYRLDRRRGQTVVLVRGDAVIIVRINEIKGPRVWIGTAAPIDMPIVRKEIYGGAATTDASGAAPAESGNFHTQAFGDTFWDDAKFGTRDLETDPVNIYVSPNPLVRTVTEHDPVAGKVRKINLGSIHLPEILNHPTKGPQMIASIEQLGGRITQRLRDAYGGDAELKYLIWPGMGGSIEDKYAAQAAGALGETIRFFGLDDVNRDTIGAIFNEIALTEQGIDPALSYEDALTKGLKQTTVVAQALGMTSYEPVFNADHGLKSLFTQRGLELQNHFWKITLDGSYVDVSLEGCERLPHQPDGAATTSGRHDFMTNGMLIPRYLSGRPIKSWVKAAKLSRYDREQARELAQWIVENERGNLDKIVLGLPEEWQGRFKALPHGIEWRDASLWIKQHFEETLGKTRRVGLNIVTNDSLDIAHCHPADSPRNDKTFLIIKVRGLKNVSDDKIAELQRAGYKVKILYFIDPATRFQVIDGSILARVMQTINYAKFDVARAWGLCAVDQPAVDFYKKIVDWMRLGAKNFTDMVASMFPPLSTSIIYDNQVTNNGITLNWTTMIQRGLLTEEELDMEISALDLDKSRPAHIAAAIHRIALRRLGEDRRPEIQYGELTYYGDLSRTQTGKAMRELLMKYGDGGLWHGVLKSFAAVGKGPGMGHGYHAMIKAHQRVLTTSIIARRYAPSLVPGLETYPEDYQVQHMLGNALALAGYDIEVGDGQELQEGRLVATEEPGWVMSIAIDENNQEARQALVGYFKEVSDILTRHPVVPAVPPQPARRTDPSGAAPAVLSEKTVTLTTETGKNLHILGDGYNILLDDVRRHFGAKQARFRISCIVLDDLAKERSMPPAWFIEEEIASTPKEVGMYVEAEVLEVRPEENLVTLKVTKFGPAAEGSETAQRDTDASGIAPEEKIAIDGDILEINRDHQTGYTVVKNRANRIWLFDPRGNVIFENIDASRGFEFTQTHLATRNGEDRLTLRDIKTGDIVFKNIDVSRGFRLTQTHLAIWNIGDRLTLRDIRTKNILFENEDIDASGGLELTQTHLATRNRGGRLTLRDIKAGDIVFEDIDASMGFRLTQTHLATRNGGARLTLRDIETEDIVFKNIDASRDFSLTQTHLTTRNKEGRLTLRDIKTEDIVFEDIDASSGFRLTQTHLATRNGEDRLTLRDIKTGDIVFKNIDVYYGFRFTQTHLATRNKGGRLTLRDIKTKDIVFQNIDASRSFRLTQTHLATCNIKGRLTLIDIKTGDIVFEDIDAYGDFGLTQTHLTTCNRGGHTTIRNIETKEVITPSNLVTYLRTSTATPPSSKTDASGAAPEIVVATNETETHDALLGILKKMNPSANGNDARNCLQRLNRLNGLGQDLIGGTFVYVEGLPLWIAVYGTYGALKLAVINIASEEILVNGIHIDGLDEYSYLRGYLYVTTGSEQYAFRVRPSGIVPPQQYPYPLTLNIRRRETDASGAAPAVLSEKTVTLTTDVGKNLHILGDGYDILLDDVRRHFGAEQARFRVSCIVLDDLAKERSMPPAWFIEEEIASTPKEVGMYVEAEVLEVDSEKNLVRLKVTRFGPATGGSRTAQGETDASGAAPGRKKAETERVETSGRMLIVTLPNGKVIRAWKASGFIRQWNKIGYEGILARPPVMHGDNEVNLWMPKEDGTLYYLNGFSMNFPLWRIIQAINYAFALQETIILDTTTDASGAAPVETDKAKVERVIAALQRAAGPVDSESTTAALELSRMASTVRSWVEEGDYINAAEMLPQSEDDLHAWFSQDIVYRMYRDAEAQLAESTTDASGAAPVLSEETVTLTTETGKDLYILGDGYDILLEGVRRYFGVKQARFRITFMQLDTAIKEYSMSPAWFIEGEVANTPRESGMYVEAEVLEVRPEEKQVTLKVTKFGPATEDSRAAQRETDPSGAAPKKKGLKVTAIGKDKGDLIIGFSDKSSIRVSDNDELASELYKKFEGRGIRIIHASDAETSDDAIRLNYYIGNQMRTSRFPFNKECGLDLISGTINRALNDAVNLLGFEEGILRVDWNGSILNVTLPKGTEFTSETNIEFETAWNGVCHRGIKARRAEIGKVTLYYAGLEAAPDYLGTYVGSFDHFSPDPTKIAGIINNALNYVEEHGGLAKPADASGAAPWMKKAETAKVEKRGRMLIVTLPNGKVIRAWKASGFIRQWNKIGYEGILARPPVMHGDNEVNLWMPKEDGTLYYLNGFSMNFPLWRIIQAINYAFALQETIILDTTTDASGAAPVETDKAKVERVIAALQRAAGPVDSESTTAALELSRMASTVRSWVEEGDYINAAEMLPQSEDDLHAWFSQDIVYRMYRDAEAQLAESTTDASGAAPVLSEETVTLTTETGKDLYILGDGYDILLEGVRRYFGVKQARFRITFMQLDTAIKEYSMSPAWFIEGEVANTPRESGMYVEAEVLEVRPEEKQVTLKVTKFGPATEDSRAAQRETDPSGAAPKKKGLKVTAIGKDKGDLIIGFSDKSSIRVSDNDELASELYKKFEGRGIRIIHASDAETSDDAIRLNYYIGNQMRTSRFPFNKECGLDLISGTINRALNDAVNLLGFEEGILRVDWNGSILNVTLPDRTKFTSENSIELEAAWNEVCHRGIKATTEEIERVVLHYSGHNAAPDYLGPYLGSFDHFSPDPTKIAEIINNALNRVEEHEEQVERTDPSGVAPGRRANPFLAELKRLLSEMTIGARQGDQRRGQGIEVVIDPTWHDAANTMNVLVAVFVFEAAEVNWEGTQIAIIDEGTGEVVAMQPLNKKGDTHFKGLESGRPYRLGVVDETAQDVEKIRVISVDPGGNKNSVVIGFNKGVPEVSGKTFAELAGSLNVLLNPRGVRAKAIDAPKAMIRPWHRRPVYAIEISYFNGKKFVYGGTFIGEPAGIINEALEKAVVPPSTTDTDPSGAAPDGKKAGTARVEKRGKTLVVTLPKTKPIRVQTVSGFIRQWNKIGYKSIEAWPVHGENDKVALWMFDEDNLIYLCDFSIYDAPQHIEIGINHALEEASTLETSTDPSGAAPGKRANPFVEDLTRFLSEMVVCEGHANFRQNDRMVVTTYVTAHEAETPNEAGTREIDLVAVAGRYGATYDIPNEAETGGIPHKAETGKIDVIVAAHAFGATDAGWKGTQIGIIDRETGEVVATQPLNVVGRADFRELDGNGEYVFMVVKEPAQGEAPSATTDASGAAPIAQTIPTMVGRLSRVVSEELRHTLEASHGFRSAPKETRASYGRGLTDAGFMTRIYTALERRFTALAQEGEEPELSLTQYDRYITRYEDVQMAAAVLFEITMPQSGPPVTERIPRQLYESGGKLWRETVESLNERAGREAYKLNYDLNLEALDTSSAEKLARDLLKQLNGSDKRYTVLYLPLWIVKILENDKERPLVGQLLERATLISYNDGGAIGDKFIVPEGLLAWGDIWRMIRFEKNVNRYFGVARSLYSALTGGKVLNRENVELIFSDPFGCLIRVFIDFPEIDAELQKWINGHGHDRLAIIELELAV